MKKSRIVSGVLAGVMAASMMTVGFSASAASAVAKPTSVKAVNVSNGIKVTWKKVTGAKSYKVYRGSKVLKTVTAASYTDKTAKSGSIYKYSVKAVKGKKTSKSSAKVSVKRLVAPKITKCVSMVTGTKRINVYWSKALGSEKYYLYRKTTGKYTKIATVKGKRSYADKSVKAGTKYTYKVKGIYKTSSSVLSAAKSNTYLAKPTSVKLTVKGTKYTLSWKKVTGATSYQVIDANKKKVATVKTTSYSATISDKNYAILNYGVIAVCSTSTSANTMAQAVYVPANAYYTDSEGNLHAKITLKAGDKFTDGALVAATIKAQKDSAQFDIKNIEGSDVATVSNYIITAKKAGTAVFEVSYDQEVAKIVNDTLASFGYSFNNKLTTGLAFVEVTVA